MKIISCFLSLFILMNSSVFAHYKGKNEVQSYYLSHVLRPELEKIKHKHEKLKSWKEVAKLIEELPGKDREAFLGRIKEVENQPFHLPPLHLTPTGFLMEIGEKEFNMNFLNGNLSVGTKTFNLKDKSAEEILEWADSSIKTTSLSSIFISEAHADPFTLTAGAIALFVEYSYAVYKLLTDENVEGCEDRYAQLVKTLADLKQKSCEDRATLKKAVSKEFLGTKLSYWVEDKDEAPCTQRLPGLMSIKCIAKDKIAKACKDFELVHECLKKTDPKAVNDTGRGGVKLERSTPKAPQERTNKGQ